MIALIGLRARRRAEALLATSAFVLAACGGGGGGPAPTPAPPATMQVTSTPPMPAVSYDTAEYRRSNGATSMSAITAYEAGATGAGVTVAVVDSGINPNLSEFSGRIHSASRDVVSARGLGDEDGHGTAVSAVLAAAKNDSGMHGTAFGSTLLALRTDAPGSCAEPEDGCQHNDSDLARAIDIATANGAKVINMSLGGSSANSTLTQAVARATQAGVIVVISAGNDSAANPDALALVATNPTASNGLVVIAGAVTSTGAMASFSNKAGSAAPVYISALGDGVATIDRTGALVLGSGTSFAAPNVSGAVALLRSAFPNLSGAQIIDILFRSATDAGDPGDDATYGQGILNLARAFQPQGSTALAGSVMPVSATDNGALGGAAGDGGQVGAALRGAVILDGYGRAFAMDLARTIAAAPQTRILSGLTDRSRSGGAGDGIRGYSVTITPATSTRPWVGLAQTGLDAEAGDRDRVRRGYVTSLIGQTTRAGMAFGYAPETLASAVGGGWRQGPWLTGGRLANEAGFLMRDASAVAMAKAAGPWTLSFAAGHATVDDPRPGLRGDAGSADTIALRAERRLGAVRVAAGLSRLVESDTLLGSRSAALGIGGATTHFASLEARADLGRGWSLAGATRMGLTEAHLRSGLIDRLGTVRSLGFSAELSKEDLLGGDRLDLRLSQPLRIERGLARLAVPVGYDYATLGTTFEQRAANLAPSGREIDVEAVYSVRLIGGDLATHAYWRRDPGHIASRGDDLGAALRYSVGF